MGGGGGLQIGVPESFMNAVEMEVLKRQDKWKGSHGGIPSNRSNPYKS